MAFGAIPSAFPSSAAGRRAACRDRGPQPLACALPELAAAALRHRHRAHAPCRCKLSRPAAAAKAAVRPVLALQPKAAYACCARCHCFAHPSPQGSRKGTRRPRLQPQAASVRCGRRNIVVPSFASPTGGTPQGTLSAQQSADRSTRPTARLPPPRAGLPAAFPPPWGSATSRRCALGSLLWPHPPRKGHKVCSRLRPLHGFFQCFRPGRGEYSHAVEPVKGTPRYARWLRHP